MGGGTPKRPGRGGSMVAEKENVISVRMRTTRSDEENMIAIVIVLCRGIGRSESGRFGGYW